MEIPGYYFDSEKKKYFKITNGGAHGDSSAKYHNNSIQKDKQQAIINKKSRKDKTKTRKLQSYSYKNMYNFDLLRFKIYKSRFDYEKIVRNSQIRQQLRYEVDEEQGTNMRIVRCVDQTVIIINEKNQILISSMESVLANGAFKLVDDAADFANYNVTDVATNVKHGQIRLVVTYHIKNEDTNRGIVSQMRYIVLDSRSQRMLYDFVYLIFEKQVIFSMDLTSDQLLVGSGDMMTLFRVSDNNGLMSVLSTRLSVDVMVVAKHGEMVFVGTRRGVVMLLDGDHCKPKGKISHDSSCILSIGVYRERLLVVSIDSIKLYDLRSFRYVGRIACNKGNKKVVIDGDNLVIKQQNSLVVYNVVNGIIKQVEEAYNDVECGEMGMLCCRGREILMYK